MAYTKYKTISDIGTVRLFDGVEDARNEQARERALGHDVHILNLNPPKGRE
jgi:hypothetical protein